MLTLTYTHTNTHTRARARIHTHTLALLCSHIFTQTHSHTDILGRIHVLELYLFLVLANREELTALLMNIFTNCEMENQIVDAPHLSYDEVNYTRISTYKCMIQKINIY